MASRRQRLQTALAVVAVGGPALWIGGALPTVVPVACLLVAAWWVLARPRAVPWATVLGLLAAAIAALHWLPAEMLGEGLAPQTAGRVEQFVTGTEVARWPGASVVPGETASEASRLVVLAAVFALGAWCSWRRAATVVAAVGCVVAIVGFSQELAGTDRIFGVYALRDVAVTRPALLTTFVNPNHQASLFVLGIASASALLVDRSSGAADAASTTSRRDQIYAAIVAIAVMTPALLVSLSRGALVAFVLLAPVAVGVALPRRLGWPSQRRPRRWPRFAIVGLPLLAMVVAVGNDGAWAELMTLAELDVPSSSAARKLRLAVDATGLIAADRPFGIGPGCFIDRFGAVDTQPGHVVYTHLESVPIAALVEYGWLGGGVLLVGALLWLGQTFVSLGRRDDRRATRLLLVGIVAVGVHNLLGFSLAQLGVAAPVALAAGSLSRAQLRLPSVARRGALVIVAAAAALGAWAIPHTVARRAPADAAVLSGDIDGEALLRFRPMDGRLHGLLARRAADEGDPRRALRWASNAVALRPGAPDPWLVLGFAYAATGDATRSAEATRRGLARLHAPPQADLVDWLLRRYPAPGQLVAVAPIDAEGWQRIAMAVRSRSPAHADALAAARIELESTDVHALQLRHAEALRRGHAALALHHARMWRAAAPQSGPAHVAVARALLASTPPRIDDAMSALRPVVRDAALTPGDRGAVEEAYVRVLLRADDPSARAEARSLARALLSRPTTRAVQRRRERLVAPLRPLP